MTPNAINAKRGDICPGHLQVLLPQNVPFLMFPPPLHPPPPIQDRALRLHTLGPKYYPHVLFPITVLNIGSKNSDCLNI